MSEPFEYISHTRLAYRDGATLRAGDQVVKLSSEAAPGGDA
jgi:hypothetical protein